MPVVGFEPTRYVPDGFWVRFVCQFHHTGICFIKFKKCCNPFAKILSCFIIKMKFKRKEESSIKIEFLNLKIDCPLYRCKQDIQYRYTYTADNRPIFSPFNGCEQMNGCETCNNCLKTEMDFIASLPDLDDLLKRYHAL